MVWLTHLNIVIYIAGTASHAHISVHSSNPTTTSTISPNLNTAEAAFIAGVLTHLPALYILNLPNYASYERAKDGISSGGTYACWGSDNREAAMRLANGTRPASRNMELKSLDGTANPHLALAGILGAGAVGIREGYELTIKDCKGPKMVAEMTEDERHTFGVTKRLPLTWEQARTEFAKDKVMDGILGRDFCEKYLAVNQVSIRSHCWKVVLMCG